MEIDGEKGTFVIIVAEYSFNNGDSIRKTHPHLLQEVEEIIASVDAFKHKTKVSKEKTMLGKLLYDPGSINRDFTQCFESKGWEKKR